MLAFNPSIRFFRRVVRFTLVILRLILGFILLSVFAFNLILLNSMSELIRLGKY